MSQRTVLEYDKRAETPRTIPCLHCQALPLLLPMFGNASTLLSTSSMRFRYSSRMLLHRLDTTIGKHFASSSRFNHVLPFVDPRRDSVRNLTGYQCTTTLPSKKIAENLILL